MEPVYDPFAARLLIVSWLPPSVNTVLVRVEGADPGMSEMSALALRVPFKATTAPGGPEIEALLIVIVNCARADPAKSPVTRIARIG